MTTDYYGTGMSHPFFWRSVSTSYKCNYSTNGTSIRWEDRKTVINVEVRLYATLRKYYPKANKSEALKVSLRKGVTLQRLYDQLNIPIKAGNLFKIHSHIIDTKKQDI